MAVETPEREQGGEEVTASTDAAASTPSRAAPVVPAAAVAAVVAAGAAVWLLARPAAPQGAAAVVDLLVLPAVLALEARLLAGRTSMPASGLATLFGIGAVGATAAVLVVERCLRAVGVSVVEAVGPAVEVLAVCAPAVALALSPAGRRRLRPADAALAGLATGLGFLVVQTSLAAAAAHAVPDYVSPLLAGLSSVGAGGGEPAAFFAGFPMAAALAGLATAAAVRTGRRAVAAAVPALAVALVAFDAGLFQWRLRHVAASEPGVVSGLPGALRQVTLHGRLAPLLLVAGLVLLRLTGRRGTTRRRPTDLDGGEPAAGPGGPADDGGDMGPYDAGADARGAAWVALPDGADGLGGAERAGPSSVPVAVLGRVALVAAVSAPAAVVLTLLARDAGLGFLERRPVALAIAVAGLAYSGASLAAPRRDDEGARVLGLAAAACAVTGVAWSLLPATAVDRPVPGGLLVDAALGWGAYVGNLGAALGLGGFAAAPPRLGRRSGGAWRALLGGSAGTRRRWGGGGLDGNGGGGGLSSGSGTGAGGWARWRLSRRRGRRRGEGAGGGPGSTEVARLPPTVVSVEPVRARPLSQVEFTGATVSEAMAAAFAERGGDLTHSSVQLVDEGSPGAKGQPARPARVRVAETAERPLVPPGRDSVLRDTPVVVVVDLARKDRAGPPPAVEVTVRAPASGSETTLSCALETSAGGRDRYRSRPYRVDAGEDAGPAGEGPPRPTASPLAVEDGDRLEVEYLGVQAVVAVFDTWATQVLAVNRALLDVTGANHAGVLRELEDLARLERPGHDDARLRHRIEQLRTRLAHVEEGRRLLAAPDGRGTDADLEARAFRTTAVVGMAMSLDRRFDDPADAAQLLHAAAAALAHHRGEAEAGAGSAPGAYRRFLATTPVGQLWAEGASSVADLSRLLGWDRLSDLADDLAGGPAHGVGGGELRPH